VKETFLPNPKGREPKLKLKLNNNNLEPPHHKRNHKFAFDIIYRGSQLPIAGKYIHSRKQRDTTQNARQSIFKNTKPYQSTHQGRNKNALVVKDEMKAECYISQLILNFHLPKN
jgi:hypothetical protein